MVVVVGASVVVDDSAGVVVEVTKVVVVLVQVLHLTWQTSFHAVILCWGKRSSHLTS